MAEFRHVYHVEGVTDLAVQKAAAERRDQAFILHEHKRDVFCDGACRAYWPNEKKGDAK